MRLSGNRWSGGIDQNSQPIPAYGEYVEGLGFRVTKVNDISQDEDPLFDVTGAVLITLMFLEVTTGTGADTQVILETDGNIVVAALTQLDSCLDGDLVLVTGSPLEFLGGVDNPCDGAFAGYSDTESHHFVIGGAGDTVVLQLDTATDTGVLFWTLFYIPLSSTATVTTAS